MRAQCSICSDLFEESSEISISAAPCGHTFHEGCLLQWLDKSGTSTCPHCRVLVRPEKIISRLYFDVADAVEFDDDDPSKLINEIHNLKLKLKQTEREKRKVEEAKERAEERVQEMKDSQEALSLVLQEEQQTSSMLRRQVEQYQEQQRKVDAEFEKYRAAQRRVRELEEIHVLLNDCERDAIGIFDQYGEKGSSELSKYCAIIKREYESVKRDKRALREELEGIRKVAAAHGRSVAALKDEIVVLRQQLSRAEDELVSTENERDQMRRRIKALRRAITAPNDSGSSSFIENLCTSTTSPQACKSPVPSTSSTHHGLADLSPEDEAFIVSPVRKVPRMSLSPVRVSNSQKSHRRTVKKQIGESLNIEQEDSERRTFPSSAPTTRNPHHSSHEQASSRKWSSKLDLMSLNDASKSTDSGTSMAATAPRNIPIGSSASSKVKTRPRSDDDTISALGTMNIFHKRVLGTEYHSNLRKGYDGMGGHTLFAQPAGQLLGRPTVKSKLGSSKVKAKAKLPPLPSLHGFLS